MTENCFDQGINGSDTSFPKKLFTQSMLTVGSVSNAHSQYINNGSFSPQTSHIPTNEPIVEQLDWPILSEPDSNDVSLHPTTQHAFVIGNTSTMTTSDHPNEVVNQGKAKPNDTDFVHEVCGELLSYMIKDDAQSEVSTESVFNSILQYPQTATEDHNSSFLLECQTMRKVGQQDVEDGLLQDDSRLSTSARKQGGAEIDYSGLSFVTQNEGLSHTATANVNFENQLTDATDQQPNMLGVDYIGPSFISQNEGLSDTADATINFENLLTDATNEQPNMSGVDISGPSFITQNEFLLDTGNANVNLENLLTDAANQQQWTDVDTANGFQDPANFLYPENIASNRSVLSSSPTDISALNSQSVTPLTTINLREFNNNMQTGGCIGGSNERSEMLSESDFGESFSDDIPSVVYSSENSDNGQSTMDFGM